MKLASWVLHASSVIILCGASAAIAAERSIHIQDTDYAMTAPGAVQTPPSRTLDATPIKWTHIQLPHVRPRAVLTKPSSEQEMAADSVTGWFRIVVPDSLHDIENLSIYAPRWNAWGSIALYADGQLVYSSLAERTLVGFNQPLLMRLPLRAAPKEVVIRMDSVRVTGDVLSSLWLGPTDELQHRLAMRRWLTVRIPEISSVILLALGMFSVSAWALRRRETSYLLFFVMTALYFLRNLHFFLEDWALPERWFGWIAVNAQGWLTTCAYLFTLRYIDKRQPRIERPLLVVMAIVSLVSAPWNPEEFSLAAFGALAYLIFIGIAVAVTSWTAVEAWRQRSLDLTCIAIAWAGGIVAGAHDWSVQTSRFNIEGIYISPFASLLVFIVYLALLLRRYLRAVATAEQAAVNLQATLAQRERQLAASYEQLRKVEEAQLLSHERQRLMREMHDGVGSALMSSLIAVERGQMRPEDIAQVLRECVDDLKLTIDSLEPVGSDLLVLLATLRYRLEPRLEAAGIVLIWEVSSLPPLNWLNPTYSLHILRMMQEVLTNTLKHARATSIRVVATSNDRNIEIAIVDNGVGFNAATTNALGRGLSNLQRRAMELGAQCEFESSDAGTRAVIRLPLHRETSSTSTSEKNSPHSA